MYMLKDKLVKNTVYASLFIQLITTLVSLDGLRYSLDPKDIILHDILILEAFVQFVEAFFYIWVILALRKLEIMTPRRYIDWMITTPTMLLSTILFMEYAKQKESPDRHIFTFTEFIQDNMSNIIKIVSANGLMLLCGYLGEINLIRKDVSVITGSFGFLLSFWIIYDNYAKYSSLGRKLFVFLISVWSLYAVAACLNLHHKNTMYNLLDIVSKNFYGLFIYGYIRTIAV